MDIYLLICLFVRLFTYLFSYFFINVCIYLFIYSFTCLFLEKQCAQICGTVPTVTRRVTVETRLKCVTREQDAVHPGVLTGGLEMLVIKVCINIEASLSVYSFIHSFFLSFIYLGQKEGNVLFNDAFNTLY